MVLLLASQPAAAFAPDGCDQQRKQYPKDWNDTAGEQALFTCVTRGAAYRLKIGSADAAGRTLMSLVPLARPGLVEQNEGVLHIWLDREQTERLKQGRYFAAPVRRQDSCWIRGDLDGDAVFFMDNAAPPSDSPDAGAFYNKAPRFSVFHGSAWQCEPVKP